MSDNAAFCIFAVFIIFYHFPVLRRINEMTQELAEIEDQLAGIRKELKAIKEAMYIVPDDTAGNGK